MDLSDARLLARSAAAAVLCLALAVPARSGGLEPPTLEDRQVLVHGRLPGTLDPPGWPRPHTAQDDFDVESYALYLFLDTAGERIEGRCSVTFRPAAGVSAVNELVLDLESRLRVSAVTPAAMVQRYEQVNDSLRIVLNTPVTPASAPATIAVEYAGEPRELDFGTLTFASHGDPPSPLVFTLSQPYLGRGWWPSKDRPDDKALLTVSVEAPEALTVVSNGVQVSRTPSVTRPGNAITTWRESHPISTYLVAVSAATYETWTDQYLSQDGLTTMPIVSYSWPELSSRAQVAWAATPDMLDFFARSFYEYPFVDEKYAHAMIRLNGGMEHQTATSYGDALVLDPQRFEFVVAHELAHQWWGDHVGPRTFESIWLNEGFATYSEALWFESRHGLPYYLRYLRDMDVLRYAPFVDFPGTVHAPTELLGRTVYYKGAWVLHMLRWVLAQPSTAPSSEALLQVLRDHGLRHGHDVASTDDFVATATARSNRNFPPLDQWFFPQWLQRTDRPHYEVGWSAAPLMTGGWRVFVRVRQLQAEPYSMPVLLRLRMSGSPDVEEVLWNDSAQADYSFDVPLAPLAVTWDPDGWVLKTATEADIDRDDDGWPDWLDGCPDVPNPAQEDRDGETTQDACQLGLDFDGDGRVNENDCAPADPAVWEVPAEDSLLTVRHGDGYAVILSVRHPDSGNQRPYLSDITAGSLSVLGESRSLDGTACLAGGVEGDFVEDSPPVTGGTYYLVFPWNGCPPAPVPTADPCR